MTDLALERRWPALQIGGLSIWPPVVLGPMAGYTNLPFRLLCRRAGAGLVTSEMVSAKALQFGSTKTAGIMETCDQERPVSLQIFGGEPETMAEAAQAAQAAGADLVDINMGCTVPKVRRAQSGVSLMADPDRAVALTRAVSEAVGVPVTVKFRAGMVCGDASFLELGRRLQDAGAAALALHARSASVAFRGQANWDCIARLVEAVQVPVVGSGDVVTADGALCLLEQTGCAGVMIARGALGRPWLFTQVRARLEGRPVSPEPDGPGRLAVALCHAQLLTAQVGEVSALWQMRSIIPHYSRGLPHATALRQRCYQAKSLAELGACVLDYIQLLHNLQTATPEVADVESERDQGSI